MKKFFYLVIACALISISNAQESNISAPESVISGQDGIAQNSNDTPSTSNSASLENEDSFVFDKIEHDFGKISESNGDVECEFTFKNMGETPLAITKVTVSCGCTAPEWPKEPIASGEQGYIKVRFNPKGFSGSFNKLLTVYSNGNPARKSLKIKGDIE